jgi:flagellar protein FlaG
MANEISSMVMAKMSVPAKESGHFVKLDATAKVPEARGLAVPEEGKELPQQATENTVNVNEVRDAVSQINDFVQTVQRDLSFNLNEESGRTVIRVIDSKSGELIRQIPSDEVLAIASHLRDVSANALNEVPQGLLFSDSI